MIMTRSRQAAADAAAAATTPSATAKSARPRALTARLARPNDRQLTAAVVGQGPAQAYAIRLATDGAERRTIDQCSAAEIMAARETEYRNLLENGVFEPAKLPRGGGRVPLLDTKEVLKVRNDNSVKCRRRKDSG